MPMFLLFLKRIPWQAWALLAILIAFALLRAHWIGVGKERCESRYKAAHAKALIEAAKQEKAAPAVAQEAIDAVQPQVTERVRIIREQIPVNSCPEYPIGVQSAISEAAAASD